MSKNHIYSSSKSRCIKGILCCVFVSWWCNMSDIFYMLSISEILYYHVIIVKSSLVTLVTCTCEKEFDIDNCLCSGDFPLLTSKTPHFWQLFTLKYNLSQVIWFCIVRSLEQLPQIHFEGLVLKQTHEQKYNVPLM